MSKSFISALFLVASYAFAQDTTSIPPTTSSASLSDSSIKPTVAAADKGPVAAVTFGYIYLASETAPDGPWNFHLHGFYGIPQYNILPWLALFSDFTQSYNTSRGAHENVQSRLGGFLFTAKSKAILSPFAFADAGVVRDSKSGSIATSPAFAVGGGVTLKLNKHVSFLFIPGEYVRTYAQSGNLNNFTGRFGIVLPLYK